MMKVLKLIAKGFLVILSIEIIGCLYLIIQANIKASTDDDMIGAFTLGWILITAYLFIFWIVNLKVSKMEKTNSIITSIVTTFLLAIIPSILIAYHFMSYNIFPFLNF